MISVITIVRNEPEALSKTINSLLEQTCQDFEYIVVNGGDCLRTHDVIAANRARINQLISEPDRGISDAFNKGTQIAKGDLLLFLNSGDTLADSRVLELAASQVGRYSELRSKIFYGDFIMCGMAMQQVVATSVSELDFTNSLNHQSMFIGIDVMKAYPYDERMRVTMDYDVWLRARSQGVEFHKLEMAISRFYEGGVSCRVDLLAYTMMSKEVCRFLNLNRNYSWTKLTLFYFRFSIILLKQTIKFRLGKGILFWYRRIKFKIKGGAQ